MQHKEQYIWALLGRFLPLFIYLATTMILARFLTPEDFGKVGVLSIFFVVANALMDAGLGGSLVKEPSLTAVDCSTILVFNISVSHFLYLLLFLCAGAIERYFEIDGLSTVVRVLCLIFVINSWGLVPRSLLTRELRFKTLTIINIVGVVAAALSSVILALLKCGVFALVAYQLINGAVTVLLSIKYSQFKLSFRFSKESFKKLFSFGIFTTLATTIDTIYENIITFLFGKYLSVQDAGYLYQAKRLEEVPSQAVASTISNVSFPVLTKLREDRAGFVTESKNTFKIVILLLTPLLLCISLYSEEIIHIIYGDQWLDAAPYLSLLIFAAIFHVAEILNRTFIKSTCRVERLFIYTVIKRVVGIGLILSSLFLDASYILYGYIISTLIGFLVNAFALSQVSDIKFWTQIKDFFIMVVPGLVFYFLSLVFINANENILIDLSVTILFLLVYYFGILRIYGIDMWDWCNNYLKHFKR